MTAQARVEADAPRPSNPSFEDVQVQWFARTGPFPAGAPTPPPPPPSTPPADPDATLQTSTADASGSQVTSSQMSTRVRGRAPHLAPEVELAAEDLDDADDLDAAAEVDVPLDSLVDAQELAMSGEHSGERPSSRLRARSPQASDAEGADEQEEEEDEEEEEETRELHPDEELDTLVTATRPWVRTRVWASED
jgi:hypothetical protein